MHEIVIASGKGGAGKTSLTAALLKAFKNKAVFCDCDVDASNLHLLLNTQIIKKEPFYSGEKAEINPQLCDECGICQKTCRFDAIEDYKVHHLSCEGCKSCLDVCPKSAISFSPNYCGNWMISENDDQLKLVHAKLFPAEDNSGKLVTKIRSEARILAQNLDRELIINDAPPGIGCPVIATLTQSSLLILLIECSVSGLHDAKRLFTVAKKLKIPTLSVLNKSGLDKNIDQEIQIFLKKINIPVIAEFPFSQELVQLLESKKSWLESKNKAVLEAIDKIYISIKKELQL